MAKNTTSITEVQQQVDKEVQAQVQALQIDNAKTLTSERKRLQDSLAAIRGLGVDTTPIQARIDELDRQIAVATNPLATLTESQKTQLDAICVTLQKLAATLPDNVTIRIVDNADPILLEFARIGRKQRASTGSSTGISNCAPNSARSWVMRGNGDGENTGSPYDTLKTYVYDPDNVLVPWYQDAENSSKDATLDAFLRDGTADKKASIYDAMLRYGYDRIVLATRTIDALEKLAHYTIVERVENGVTYSVYVGNVVAFSATFTEFPNALGKGFGSAQDD